MPVILVLLFIFLNLATANSLDLPSSKIADDSLLRIRLRESWMTEAPARVITRTPAIHILENGERVEVRATENRDEIMVIFSRELMRGRVATETHEAIPRRPTGQFPGWAQGSWMLTRRKDTGAGTLIRVFLRSDQFTYIQFRPFNNERCLMDVVVYGGYVARSVPIPVPFERLYTMPVNDALRLAGDKFPRQYFDPDPVYYRDSRRFIAQVRENLGGLRYANDGAIDENGYYVLIDSLQRQNPATAGLNCSGFAKWLIDGILRPVTGQRLTIPPLKAPFGNRGSSFTEHWEERRDPYFGLDWIRNLASEANGILRSDAFRVLEEFEVRNNNFSSVLVNENRTFVIHNYPGFLENAGFGFEGLHPLLYTLAVDNPFKFYLAAVNTEIGAPVTRDNLRGTPRLRQYFHVAALVPYFDEFGIFRIVVFESAAETSFNAFRNRYPGHFVNLVQIPIVSLFDP
jgi:hypothetical protein